MRVFNWILSVRYIPHVIVYYSQSKKNLELLNYERDLWLERNRFKKHGVRGFLFLLNMFPEYRSLFYYRTSCKFLSFFAKRQTNLYFHTPSSKIGKGLVIWHGYSTVINAESIGENCQIWHLTTIGKKTTLPQNDKPIIGDNVSISTGAIVIGNIRIGANSVIGAGSTVVHDVPENSVVIGVAASVYRK